MSNIDNFLTQQVNIATSFVASLQSQQESYTQISSNLESQATALGNLQASLVDISNNITDLNENLRSMSERLISLSETDTTRIFGNSSTINNRMNSFVRNISNMMLGNQNIHDTLQEVSQQAVDNANQTQNLSREAERTVDTVQTTSETLQEGTIEVENETSRIEKLTTIISGIGIFARAIQTMGLSLLIDVPKLIFSGVQIAANVATTAFGIMFSVYKTILTLPFSIANNFIGAGNAIRQKIDETMANSLESVKDNFDLGSSIGKGAAKTKKALEGRLIEFENKSSELFKQFGSPEAIIDYLNTTTAGLGMYSEVFGGSLTGSIENIHYMKKMQSQLALSTEHLKYYAMEAYNDVVPINEVLARVSKVINTTATKNKIDSKRLSTVFNSLRTNIIDFGHISHITLAEISAKIIKYKVSAEDVAGIFGKFTSYEDAANTSAQLFQSFGMVVDAYDLIASENPMDIIETLRESMFNTGRDFASLNRHEKSYLKNLVGISEQSMAAIFSYENISMSHEEIRNKMASENPAEIQIKSLKEMTSAIKVFRKVVTYESPFSALFAGLMENSATNEQMRKVTTELSAAFESLNQMMLGLDDKTIENISIPLTLILKDFSRMVTDGTLVRIFTNATEGIGQLFIDIFTTSSKTKTDDFISQTLSLNDAYTTTLGEKSKEFQSLLLNKFKTVFNNLKGTEAFTDAAKEKGLLDDKGNLKSDDINTIGTFLITSLNSRNEALAKAVENQSNVFNEQLAAAKAQIKVRASQESGNVKATLDALSSADHYNTIIAMLKVRINEMFKDGSGLMTRMFDLGREIAGGIYKGIFKGVTTLLEILRGGKGVIAEMFPNDDTTREDKFAKLIGFKNYAEYDTYLSRLGTSVTNMFEKHKGKLWDGFKFISKMLWDVAGDIFNLVKSAIISTMADVYYSGDLSADEELALWALMPKETRQKLALSKQLKDIDTSQGNRTVIIDSLSNISKKDIISNKEYNSKSNSDLILQFNNALKKLSLDMEFKTHNSTQAQRLTQFYKKVDLSHGDSPEEKLSFIKKYKKSFETLIESLRDESIKAKLAGINRSFFTNKKPTNDQINTFFDYMIPMMSNFTNEHVGSKKTKLMYADDVLSTQDLKLHEKDNVEVIASKQGGMLVGLYSSIKEKYDIAITNVKSVLNKEQQDIDIEDEVLYVAELIDNLNIYIDNLSKNKNNIVVGKTRVVG